MRYLGIPIHYRRLSNADWKRVEECFEKRLNSWKGKHLSTSGRLTLINSVLSSLPMYMMSIFCDPKRSSQEIRLLQIKIFFDKVKNKNENTDEPNRTYYTNPKTKVGLELTI